jgi:hypothetical protein
VSTSDITVKRVVSVKPPLRYDEVSKATFIRRVMRKDKWWMSDRKAALLLYLEDQLNHKSHELNSKAPYIFRLFTDVCDIGFDCRPGDNSAVFLSSSKQMWF